VYPGIEHRRLALQHGALHHIPHDRLQRVVVLIGRLAGGQRAGRQQAEQGKVRGEAAHG